MANQMRDICSVYVLMPQRSFVVGAMMLDAFLPNRIQAQDEYIFPEFATSPEAVFDSPERVIPLLEQDTSQEYSLYWHDKNQSGGSVGSMVSLHYTSDGGLIFGVSTYCDVSEAILHQAARIAGASFGTAYGEQPPPFSVAEFKVACATSMMPRLVDGIVHT
jgi:hypothetical protein